jgi:hypothetical protein
MTAVSVTLQPTLPVRRMAPFTSRRDPDKFRQLERLPVRLGRALDGTAGLGVLRLGGGSALHRLGDSQGQPRRLFLVIRLMTRIRSSVLNPRPRRRAVPPIDAQRGRSPQNSASERLSPRRTEPSTTEDGARDARYVAVAVPIVARSYGSARQTPSVSTILRLLAPELFRD